MHEWLSLSSTPHTEYRVRKRRAELSLGHRFHKFMQKNRIQGNVVKIKKIANADQRSATYGPRAVFVPPSSGVRRKFSRGDFIQWHMVVICVWCALFVTSRFDVCHILVFKQSLLTY